MTLTEQEARMIDALRPYAKKAKQLGWKLPEDTEDKVLPNGTHQFVILDPQGQKHWMRVTPSGMVYFAPVCMTGL